MKADAQRLGFDVSRLARVRPWMARYVEAGKLPGALTLIARHGEIAYLEAVGARNVTSGAPLTPDTLLRVYSMSKPVTSVALMQLYERALFHLDDPIAAYLPEFADVRVLAPGATRLDQAERVTRPPTIHHLLTHTSGLTYGFNEGLLADAYREHAVDFEPASGTLAEVVRRLARLPLAFEPGARWNYGVSTDVVGRLIEVIAGAPLDRVLHDHIFAPLGMDETAFWAVDEGRLASLYRPDENDRLVLMEDATNSAYRAGLVTTHSGGGGLISTVLDYWRFAEMLRRGGSLDGERILGPRTLAFMARNHLPGDLAAMGQPVFSEISFAGIGFGLGWWVMLDPARAQVLGSVGDYGWGGAASTVFWVDPVEDMVVLFATQLVPSSHYPLRKELRALVYQALVG